MNKTHSAKNILQRIKKAYNLSRDGDLAGFLGVAQSTLSSWKQRNSLDYDILFAKCEKLNMNWMIFGEGQVWRNQDKKTIMYASEPLTDYLKDQGFTKRIKNLDIDPEQKLELFENYINILEDIQKQEGK